MSIDVKVYFEKVDMISKDLSHGPLRVLYCQDVSKLTNEVARLSDERDALLDELHRVRVIADRMCDMVAYNGSHGAYEDIRTTIRSDWTKQAGLRAKAKKEGKALPPLVYPAARLLPGEVAVPVRDLFSMLVSHVRYSMGRMTYIVGECCERVRWYWPHLEQGHRDVILRDVTEELAMSERTGRKLGMDFDHAEWVALKNWMLKNR